MKFTVLATIMATLLLLNAPVTAEIVNGNNCADVCWGNSLFVTSCGDQIDCLCHDMEFQTAVYRCLSSQCKTTHFGSALYEILSRCPVNDFLALSLSPPLIAHDNLRKRENNFSLFGSASISGSSQYSGYYRSASASASAYYRYTRSVPRGSGDGSLVRSTQAQTARSTAQSSSPSLAIMTTADSTPMVTTAALETPNPLLST